VPSWLHRIEEHVELAGWLEAPECTKEPIDYFRSNCWVTTECDEHLLYHTIEELGDDRILFETDYPHPDSKYRARVVDVPRQERVRGGEQAQDPLGQRGRLLPLPGVAHAARFEES
jgi:predicted TIM-barrel fold metal-dependent hydrolase